MKNHLFLYSLLIFTVIFIVGCTTGVPQLPVDSQQGNEADQENNQDESTGVPRVVFIELFNTDGCAASKAINPIIEEIVAEYENTEVILVEEAGWGIYSTEETSERSKWYFSDNSELHTPSICFNGLNQSFAQGISLGGGGNSGNSESGDTEDNGDPETGEVDTTKPDLVVIENIGGSVTVDLQKWSGLGMITCDTYNASEFDTYVDTLLANGFTEIRIAPQTWNAPEGVANTKVAAISAIAKGAHVIWGVGQWNGGEEHSQYPPITVANWEDYRQAILDAAQWAQDNSVYEFSIGNEAELQIDGTIMTVAEMIANLKAVATEVKAIFTNGKVSYSCSVQVLNDWITAGKGDIDLLAFNLYMSYNVTYNDDWKIHVDNLVNAFGVDGTYISEFAPSSTSLDDYSTDEAIQAAGVTEMIEYIKASGITRALAFLYRGYTPTDELTSNFGILKTDGTYRLLWYSLLASA